MSPTSTYTPPYQLTDTVLSLSTEIAATVKEITVRGNLSAQPQLHRANRIRSVHSSLAIEHNSLTLDQVTALLNGKRVLAPQQEVWEVQNAFRAYDLLPSLDPYSIDDLLKVHRVMMDGLVMGAGTFRNTGVGVYAGDQLIHAGTPAQYVPEAMQQLFEWLRNTTAHPLVASCVFHYEFEFIHPFADGNGRVGRLWHTLLLSKWNPAFAWLPVESIIHDRQQEYYDAINASNDAGESTVFIEFMLSAIKASLIDAINTSDEMSDGKLDKDTLRWNKIQEYLKTHDYIMNADVRELCGVSAATANRILARFTSEGKLAKYRESGHWVYILSS